MGQAFSCIIKRNGDVYWKMGMDFHDTTLAEFGLTKLDRSDDPEDMLLARVEVRPSSKLMFPYLHPETEWKVYTTKDYMQRDIAPLWFNEMHEDIAKNACKDWKKQVYNTFNMGDILEPVNPFSMPLSKFVLQPYDIDNLQKWSKICTIAHADVWEKVSSYIGPSVSTSASASITLSLSASVFCSVSSIVNNDYPLLRAKYLHDDSIFSYAAADMGKPSEHSLYASLWNALAAYSGSLFIDVPGWEKEYPYQCAADLWRRGFIPLYDGYKWILIQGRTSKIVV